MGRLKLLGVAVAVAAGVALTLTLQGDLIEVPAVLRNAAYQQSGAVAVHRARSHACRSGMVGVTVQSCVAIK